MPKIHFSGVEDVFDIFSLSYLKTIETKISVNYGLRKRIRLGLEDYRHEVMNLPLPPLPRQKARARNPDLNGYNAFLPNFELALDPALSGLVDR